MKQPQTPKLTGTADERSKYVVRDWLKVAIAATRWDSVLLTLVLQMLAYIVVICKLSCVGILLWSD